MWMNKYSYTADGKVNGYNHFGDFYTLVVSFKVKQLNIFWPNIYMLNRNIYDIY